MRTEKEKMLAGELYRGGDPELRSLRHKARKLMRAYNQSLEEESDKRTELMGELFGAAGSGSYLEPPFYCDYGANIFVGKEFYMNFGGTILDCAEVHIGDYVLCGPHVQIYTATHPIDAEERAKGPESAKPIRIGSKVWIGGGSIICPGVKIGEGTTIGAGSVVTRDIPANVFAAGNPCRVIRKLKD